MFQQISLNHLTHLHRVVQQLGEVRRTTADALDDGQQSVPDVAAEFCRHGLLDGVAGDLLVLVEDETKLGGVLRHEDLVELALIRAETLLAGSIECTSVLNVLP